MTRLIARTKNNPTTEIIVSSNVQVAKVSLIDKLKYSLNIQNPASLTCEAIKLPAPVARTINAGLAEPATIIGVTRPAVVNAATVAELDKRMSAKEVAKNGILVYFPRIQCSLLVKLLVSGYLRSSSDWISHHIVSFSCDKCIRASIYLL